MTRTTRTAPASALEPAEPADASPPHREPTMTDSPDTRSPPDPTNSGEDLPKGKLGILVSLLRRPEGARVSDLAEASGWQTHSVRGAMAGALKARGYVITSEPREGGRTYRIAPAAAQ